MRLRYSLPFLSALVAIGSLAGGVGPSPVLAAVRLSHQPPVPPGVDDLYNAGVDLKAAGRYEEAIEKFTGALAKREIFPDAWMERGICYAALRKWDQAVGDFTRYIGRKPAVCLAYLNRASAYIGKRMYAEAVNDYGRALAHQPKPLEQASAYLGRGDAYVGLQEYERAVGDYTRALTLPNSGDPAFRSVAYVNRAGAYLAMSPPRVTEARADVVSAAAVIAKTVARDPRSLSGCYLYVTLARVREQLSDYSGAVADYETFLRLQPEYPERAAIVKEIERLKGKSVGL